MVMIVKSPPYSRVIRARTEPVNPVLILASGFTSDTRFPGRSR